MEPIYREETTWKFIEFALGRPVRSHIKNGICAMCLERDVVANLKNAKERKEFSMSGMCSACQTKIFK